MSDEVKWLVMLDGMYLAQDGRTWLPEGTPAYRLKQFRTKTKCYNYLNYVNPDVGHAGANPVPTR